MGTHDVQNNTTFHAAEGAIEKMTSDLAGTFQNIESPTVSQITGSQCLAAGQHRGPEVSRLHFDSGHHGQRQRRHRPSASSFGQIASGPYQGLSAELLPVTLQATAQGASG